MFLAASRHVSAITRGWCAHNGQQVREKLRVCCPSTGRGRVVYVVGVDSNVTAQQLYAGPSDALFLVVIAILFIL
jgi:hypothetical protein